MLSYQFIVRFRFVTHVIISILRIYFHLYYNHMPFNLLKRHFSNQSYQAHLQHFLSNLPLYQKPLTDPNPTLLYTSLFARSTLIARNHIDIDPLFIKIKKNILNQDKQLSPKSCSLLMESLSYFPFHGDQTQVLQKLCSYFDKNSSTFNALEFTQFQKGYMKIMGTKAHTTIKFRPVKLQHNQKFKLKRLISSRKVQPHPDISNLNIPSQRQINFTFNFDDKAIIIRVLGLPQPNSQMQMFQQVHQMASLLKKSDCFIFQSQDEQINGDIPFSQIQSLSTKENYASGLYQVDGKIHKWLTFLMNIPEKKYKDKKFIIHNGPTIDYAIQEISEYISIIDAKEAFGLGSLCYFHQLLYQNYKKSAEKLQIYEEKQKLQTLGVQKYHKQKANQNTQLLNLTKLYHPPIDFVKQNYWQVRDQFSSAKSMITLIEKQSKKYSNFTILLNQQIFLPFVIQLLESKFLRIPPYQHKDPEVMGIMFALMQHKSTNKFQQIYSQMLLDIAQ